MNTKIYTVRRLISTLKMKSFLLATLWFWEIMSSWMVSKVCSKSSNWSTLMVSSALVSCSWIVFVIGRFTRILAGLEWNSTSWLGATSPCGLKWKWNYWIMVFCYQNCSDLLQRKCSSDWVKFRNARLKAKNLQKFLHHLTKLFE